MRVAVRRYESDCGGGRVVGGNSVFSATTSRGVASYEEGSGGRRTEGQRAVEQEGPPRGADWSCCPVVLWSCCPVVLWSCGPVVLWSCGPVVLWSCGPVVLWSCGPAFTVVLAGSPVRQSASCRQTVQ